jgi:hypothetical protein
LSAGAVLLGVGKFGGDGDIATCEIWSGVAVTAKSEYRGLSTALRSGRDDDGLGGEAAVEMTMVWVVVKLRSRGRWFGWW